MDPEQQTQTEPQYQPQTAVPALQPETNKTDKLGFVSIVLGLTVVFALPGFIVGLIGASKSKALGVSPKISRIGWILSALVLVVSSVILFLWLRDLYIDEQNKMNDTTSKYEIQKIQTELDRHYSSGYGFPISLSLLQLSKDDLVDSGNKPYKYSPKNCSKIFAIFLESSSTLSKVCQEYTITTQLSSTGKNFTLKSKQRAYVDAKKISENKIKKDKILEKISKKATSPLPESSAKVGIIIDVNILKDNDSAHNPARSSGAKNGDIEVFYISSNRLIIYRESSDKILYDGPIQAKPKTSSVL